MITLITMMTITREIVAFRWRSLRDQTESWCIPRTMPRVCLQNCLCFLYSRPCSGASDAPSQLWHRHLLHRLSWADRSSASESDGCAPVSPLHPAPSRPAGALCDLYQGHRRQGFSFRQVSLAWGSSRASCPDYCSFCVPRASWVPEVHAQSLWAGSEGGWLCAVRTRWGWVRWWTRAAGSSWGSAAASRL